MNAEPPMRALRAGGRYELLARLSRGGTASVWRARDRLLGVDRALKVLHPAYETHASARSRFLAEARALAALDHPHVVRLYDAGEDEEGVYLVMELVPRGSVASRLRADGAMSPADALAVVFQVLCALDAAHARGIVHRDVKPANVLVVADRHFALADFGIARLSIGGEHRTSTGAEVGTRGYASPEQRVDAHRVGPAADLYGAGATLYALVTGKPPPEYLADAPALSTMPPEVARVILRATAWLAKDRYASAVEMARAVAEARDAVGPAAPGREWLARLHALSRRQLERPPPSPAISFGTLSGSGASPRSRMPGVAAGVALGAIATTVLVSALLGLAWMLLD